MREMRWILRMVRLVRNPPSWQRVALVVAVVLAALALVIVDQVIGWPEALTVNRGTRVLR